MKKQALFVTEKWCDANPALSLTNNFHNLFNSFNNSCPDFNYNTVHIDEASIVYDKHIDEILPKYCEMFKVDIIIYSLLGLSQSNPSINTFKKIKNLGIYQCIMWPDTTANWGINAINQIGDAVNLNILWDNPTSDYHDSVLPLPRTECMWVPQDNNMFCDSNNKDIDVSFIGSDRYPDRKKYIQILQKNIDSFVFRGGQREEKLTPIQYANLIKRSKISINFAGNPEGFWQCKGRVYEVLACNSLLLESTNPSTRKILKHDEYIEFYSPTDLINKIKYYLANDDERIKIANNGYNKYVSTYSAKIFWHTIIEKMLNNE